MSGGHNTHSTLTLLAAINGNQYLSQVPDRCYRKHVNMRKQIKLCLPLHVDMWKVKGEVHNSGEIDSRSSNTDALG